MRLVGRTVVVLAIGLLFAAPGAAGGTHDGSPPHTSPEIVAAPVYVKPFAAPGGGPGELDDPWHVALLPSGDLVVADTGNDRIQIFTRFGRSLSQFGVTGAGPGEFIAPRGVAVGVDGTIFVSDTGNHRIQVFTSDGSFIRQFGSEGSAPGEFSSPSGISLTAAGDLVVADAGNHRVQVLDPTGAPRHEFGELGTGDGQLDTPIDVASDLRGRVFVAERAGGRISVFDGAGTFLDHISSPGSGDDQLSMPSGVFIDDHDVLHVMDTGNGRVQGFVANDDYRFGEHRWSFAEPVGSNAPRGLVVDERGRTFVSDPSADHVEIWRYLKCMGRRGTHVGTDGDDFLAGHDPQGDFFSFVLIGRGGNDVLSADVVGDVMCGGAGDDRIFGVWGNDEIRGDAGNDYIEGGALGDTIRGNKGDDYILGLNGRDVIFGNEGNDTIEGGDGPDHIYAGPGDDMVDGGTDNDRLVGGPDYDICDGGSRGAPGDAFQQCEEIVESPAPEGWYRIGAFAWRAGPVFGSDFDIDPSTGLLWGASRPRVLARDHAGEIVFDLIVGGRPEHVQAHNGEIFYLDRAVDTVFVMTENGDARRDWNVESVCDIEVTANRVMTTDGSNVIKAFDHAGTLRSEIVLDADSACTFSVHRDRIFVWDRDDTHYFVSVYGLGGQALGETARQVEQIHALDVDRDGLVWVSGGSFQLHGFLRAYSQGGELLHVVEGFADSPGVWGVVADRNAVWISFNFDFQHGSAARMDVFTNLSCDGKSLTHVGSPYADTLVGTGGNDVIHMGDGADTVSSLAGADTVCGGRGSDSLDGGLGADLLLGGNGDDSLAGGSGEDECRGGGGDDTATGCEATTGVP